MEQPPKRLAVQRMAVSVFGARELCELGRIESRFFHESLLVRSDPSTMRLEDAFEVGATEYVDSIASAHRQQAAAAKVVGGQRDWGVTKERGKVKRLPLRSVIRGWRQVEIIFNFNRICG